MIDNDKINALEVIWDYMHLNQEVGKSDLIIGCGSNNLDIPAKCARLYNDGYANKILFTGGLGKITKDSFNKTEAEVYRDIAIKNGVKGEDIIIENESTNTGDNFRFSKVLLDKMKIKWDKIIIVHTPFSERRTYSSAKAILNDKEIIVTSPDMTFSEYLDELKKKSNDEIFNDISVRVGDIQRMIIYPQFGWQIKNQVPIKVIDAYDYLKRQGFDKYILSNEKIRELIDKYGLVEGQKANYFK